MIKFFKYLFAISMLVACISDAQSLKPNQAVATITASATVEGNVDVIVMKDLEFEITSLSPTELIVDPQKNPFSGEIKIVGNPNSLVRVTNERESILRHENGQLQLYFRYILSGNTSEVQRESVLLTQNNEVRLSDRGAYYLWVGGQLSGLENIIPGNYGMELTIEVEYIL